MQANFFQMTHNGNILQYSAIQNVLNGMIPFSGLSRFSGHFVADGPSPLNRDTTVAALWHNLIQKMYKTF